EEMLKSIDTQNAPNKFRIHCSVEALPFKQNSIDVILCIDLIHHFYSRGIYQPLQQLLRCLKAENGFLFLEEVNKYALYRIPYSFLPLKLLNILRTFKAVYKKHLSKPATYEAPLSIFKVRFYLEKISKELNKTFKMEVIPTKEYPNAGKLKAYIYSRKFIHPIIHKYLGFHWFIIFSTGIKKI
ncbi:MAG: class I SAM-dependent methyltransferase, partial [Candidatus Margulisbacteria bacterium]|nr:class I SAM-dependent methyltransferase [Candidatus Margulisiibacteriota bacterium]